jgi:hypothetical protein
VPLFHERQPSDDRVDVDEAGLQQGADEVLVLLAESAQFAAAQILLVEAPTGELRCSGRGTPSGFVEGAAC